MDFLHNLFGKKQPTSTPSSKSQTSILVYVFCNGFRPDDQLLGTLSLTWLIQEYGQDKQTLERMSVVLRNAEKYGYSIPEVPSDSWADIANLVPIPKVKQLHPNRETQFVIFSQKTNPKMPDALIAVVFGIDETDLAQAQRLMANKEI